MVLVSLPQKRQKTTITLFFGVAFVVLPLLLAACGGTTTTGNGTPTSNALSCDTAPNNSAPTPTPYPASTNLATPSGLITPGTLTVGSDTTYPPQEFIDTASGNATGFDVDLITAMAQKLGLQAKVVTANFTTILDDL